MQVLAVNRVTTTLKELIADRGVPAAEITSHEDDEGRIVVLGGTEIVAVVASGPAHPPKVGIGMVRETAKLHPGRDMILVSDGGATPYIAGHQHEISETTGGRRVETFRTAELQFNLTKHCLVPRHWRMDTAEVEECLRRHGVADTSYLPRIVPSDPVVRYYGWPCGTVVGVDRCDMNDTGLAVRSTGVRVVGENIHR